jgi:hypothetical protein
MLKWNIPPLAGYANPFQTGISYYRLHSYRMAPRSQHSHRYKVMLQHLRRARQDSGLTQVEVARALGNTQGYVSKCEQGERRIDAIELSDFAQVYGKRIDTFLPPSTAPRLTGVEGSRRVAERSLRPKGGRRAEPK